MKPDPQPAGPLISSARKILQSYADRTSAIKVFHSDTPSATVTAPGKKDSLDVFSEKLASLEQLINSETNENGSPFQKIKGKLEYELARPPVRLSIIPETPDSPAETVRGEGKSPAPPPVAPAAAVNAPESALRRRKSLYVLAASLALLLAGFGVYRQAQENSAGYYREYPGVTANISGMVWVGEKLFVGDWLTQAVYVYSVAKEGLRLEGTFPLKGTHISGLAAAGDTLYVADSWNKTIEARQIAAGLPLLCVFSAIRSGFSFIPVSVLADAGQCLTTSVTPDGFSLSFLRS